MSRQADREGYPEVAEAYKRIAFEEAEHAAKFAELLGEVVTPSTKKNLELRVELSTVLPRVKRIWQLWLSSWVMMLYMIPYMRCVRMRQDMAVHSRVC